MRRIRYCVAASLDGYIAATDGQADWIVMDPEFDFNELYQQFDTLLIGGATFESMAAGGGGMMPGMETIVFSRTLNQADYPDVTVVGDDGEVKLRELRQQPGKDIWLFGGGSLFRSLVDAGLVDAVEIAIKPVLLGGGTPLLPPTPQRVQLNLVKEKTFKTDVVSLEYAVEGAADKEA